MNQQNYQCSFTANITATEALENISHVSEWWTGNYEGSSKKPGDTFTVRFGETFVNFEIVEAIPNKKIVWQVVDCNLHWLKDKKEWKGTQLSWEVSPENNSTRINMTHVGLIPEIECYENCKKGWDFYAGESLKKLMTEHKGMPETPKANR